MIEKTIAEEEIARRLDALPDAIAEAFESDATARVVLNAGKTAGLAIDTIGAVAREVGYVMLGVTPAAEFVSAVTGIVGDRKKAEEIAAAISQQIFLPIREAMKRAYGTPWAGTPATDTGASIPGPRAAAPPPQPPKPVPPSAGAAAPKKLEPLIIRPLPSPSPTPPGEPWAGKPPREVADSGQWTPPQAVPSATGQVADRGQPIVANDAAPAPAVKTPPEEKPAPPPVMIKPVPPPAPKALEAILPRTPEKPALPRPAAIEPAAPIISPLGMRPPQEPYQPPPPAQAYERSREAFQRELASAAAGRPTSQPEPRPVSGASVPPAPLGTKEALQQEIEKFRQAGPDAQPRHADGAPPAPPSPSQLSRSTIEPVAGKPQRESWEGKPLKLPQEKIPKPQAPERYDIDPYKEPTE